MSSIAVTPDLSRALIDFSLDLARLRVPDPINWAEGPLELPESMAERGFRAAQIGFALACQEGLAAPEEISSRLLVRDLPTVVNGNEAHSWPEGASLADRLARYGEALGEFGAFLTEMWRETSEPEGFRALLANDAYLLSEAFSLLEQRARGNLAVGARLEDLREMLYSRAAAELLREAELISPFRYWQEFSAETPESKALADFIFEIGKLRLESRSGWQYLGIRHESVAAHSFRGAQMGLMMGYFSLALDPDLGPVDPHQAAAHVTMHDLPEARSGDPNLVAKAYVSGAEARVLSDQTMNLGRTGLEISRMWHAVETRSTPAGKIGKDADRLEMVVEALNLIEQGIPAARAWISNTTPLFGTEIGRQLCAEVVERAEASRHRAGDSS